MLEEIAALQTRMFALEKTSDLHDSFSSDSCQQVVKQDWNKLRMITLLSNGNVGSIEGQMASTCSKIKLLKDNFCLQPGLMTHPIPQPSRRQHTLGVSLLITSWGLPANPGTLHVVHLCSKLYRLHQTQSTPAALLIMTAEREISSFLPRLAKLMRSARSPKVQCWQSQTGEQHASPLLLPILHLFLLSGTTPCS